MNYYTAPAIKHNYTQEFIHEAVCQYFKVHPDQILTERKTKDLAYPRFLSMHFQRVLIRENQKPLALKKIARFFKKKDHTTVRNALMKVNDLSDTWDEFRQHKENLQKLFIVEAIKKTA